jgi:nitrogen fixation/metabolism regulation signal transduction histidine kinase
MGSNRFYISIVIYCLLIFISAFLFFFFLTVRNQPSTAAGVAIIAVLLLFRLLYYVNRTNRILSAFLVYMQEKDPSLSYTVRYADKSFRGLNESLGRLIEEFKENRVELEIQAQYLDAILSNISTGILCFDDSGSVQTINKAARQLLGSGPIRQLEEIEKVDPGLATRLLNLQPGKELSEQIGSKGKRRHLSVNCSRIKQGGNTINIISLNDISNQMEAQEISSWKKLIRVINHEVMNSMTPIITLAMAIRNKLTKVKTPEALDDAVKSAGIIEERSSGLVGFIERYKKLTGLPPPKIETLVSGELFARIEKLYGDTMKDQGIQLNCQSDCKIELEADRQMMEQVLINLVQNAMDAVRNSRAAEIELSCFAEAENQICIKVSDNGEGIPAERMEQVFVPFFTTREEGSGIGLSLCKQIVRLHHGSIHMDSKPGKGTRVLLRF